MKKIICFGITILILLILLTEGCSGKSQSPEATPPTLTPPTLTPPTTETPQTPQPQTQEPSEYGVRPSKANYEAWKAKDYPYLAKLPAGTEGKVQVAYNYLVERPLGSRYSVEIKITNLSNQSLVMLYYNEFLKDGEGNILTAKIDEGHHNVPNGVLLQPGGSIILRTGISAFQESFGAPSPVDVDAWTVEIEVTYLKFE